MKKGLFFAVFLSMIFIAGCSSGSVIKDFSNVCNGHYFEYKKGDCCLDTNNNQVCDNDENLKIEPGSVKPVVEEVEDDSEDEPGFFSRIFGSDKEEVLTEEVLEQNVTEKVTGEIVKEVNETSDENELSSMSADELCLYKFNLNNDDIIFRYSDWSSFDDEWNPVIDAVEALGYTFIRAKVGNDVGGSFFENEAYMDECFKGIYHERTVPEFICAGNKATFIAVNPDVYVLRDFAEDCKE